MNFSDVDVRLGDRVFVVGPNASGKSNLLDVLRFLRDVSSPRVGGLHHAVSSRGGIKAIRCLAARRVSGVRVSVDIGMKDASGDGEPLWRYELVFSEDQRHRPVVERERVVHKGKTVLERPDDEDRADPDRLAQTHLEQIASNRRFRDLAKFFASARYLHVVPQLIRASGRSAGLDEDQFGRGFVERVANTHASTRKARLTRIQGALRVVVPQLKNSSSGKTRTDGTALGDATSTSATEARGRRRNGSRMVPFDSSDSCGQYWNPVAPSYSRSRSYPLMTESSESCHKCS